jgi:hypothetical protein
VAKAPSKTRCEQGQRQDFQSDVSRSRRLKTAHAERKLSFHHDHTPFHDASDPFAGIPMIWMNSQWDTRLRRQSVGHMSGDLAG